MAISEETRRFYDKEIGMPRWGWLPHRLLIGFKQMHVAGNVTRGELRQIGTQFKAFGADKTDSHRQKLLGNLLPKAVELHTAGKHREAVELLLKHSASKQALVNFLEPKPVEPSFELEHAGATHVGFVRRNNEDNFVIDSRHGVFVVADGMGGHGHGELAARIAVHQVVKNFDPKNVTSLHAAFFNAHNQVRAAQVRNNSNMGTTLTALHLTEKKGHIVHVGDTRVYRLRDGKLEQLTTDHQHPSYQNVITQCIGMEEDSKFKPEVKEVDIKPQDVFMLCSDGLNKHVSDEIIAMALQRYASNRATHNHTVAALINAANQGGGSDNTTVIIARVKPVKH